MNLSIDKDLECIASFMEANFAATKLVPLAEALALLAPSLWGQYDREALVPLALRATSPSAEQKPASANQ